MICGLGSFKKHERIIMMTIRRSNKIMLIKYLSIKKKKLILSLYMIKYYYLILYFCINCTFKLSTFKDFIKYHHIDPSFSYSLRVLIIFLHYSRILKLS